jgi:hypothetical protein
MLGRELPGDVPRAVGAAVVGDRDVDADREVGGEERVQAGDARAQIALLVLDRVTTSTRAPSVRSRAPAGAAGESSLRSKRLLVVLVATKIGDHAGQAFRPDSGPALKLADGAVMTDSCP